MLITVGCDVFLSPARVLVNPVNTVGVMGSGVSGEFKRFFPATFASYKRRCDAGKLEIGGLWLRRDGMRDVLHLPIKSHWRSATKLEDVEICLQRLAGSIPRWALRSLALPAFAESELDFDAQILPLIDFYLSPLMATIYLHRPTEDSPRRSIRTVQTLLSQPSGQVPFEKFWRDMQRGIKRDQGRVVLPDKGQARVEIVTGRTGGRVILTPETGAETTLTQSQLGDLWSGLVTSGLLVSSQFPSMLVEIAPMLIGLLSSVDYVVPVRAGFGTTTGQDALLLIAPPTSLISTLTLEEAG